MISTDVRFGRNKAPEIAFVLLGQVVLHDTCMVVSGPVLRFRLPLFNGFGFFAGLLSSPSYRTVPYGAVVRSKTRLTLTFRRRHIIDYRLPSGKEVRLSFTVSGGAQKAQAFRSALDENLTATKALFEK